MNSSPVTESPFDSIAAVGDVSDPDTWSGVPWHFYHASVDSGWKVDPWKLNLSRFNWARIRWNLLTVLRGRKPGGFQYSNAFLEAAERQIPEKFFSGRILSFNQHFPRSETVRKHGGRLYYYLDASFPRLLDNYGLAGLMDPQTAREALAAEKRNLDFATHIITFQNWTKDSLIQECNISPKKISMVLPGANIHLNSVPPVRERKGRPGKDIPLVLGFVGKDWKRKGLRLLVEVARIIQRRGYLVKLKVAGGCPLGLRSDPLVDYAGFINKATNLEGYLQFVHGCHIGCLFSRAEAASIVVLDFLRLGVPVAGYVVDGMGDLFFPSASLRFEPLEKPEHIAKKFISMLETPNALQKLQEGAQSAQPYVTWQRCLDEIQKTLSRV